MTTKLKTKSDIEKLQRGVLDRAIKSGSLLQFTPDDNYPNQTFLIGADYYHSYNTEDGQISDFYNIDNRLGYEHLIHTVMFKPLYWQDDEANAVLDYCQDSIESLQEAEDKEAEETREKIKQLIGEQRVRNEAKEEEQKALMSEYTDIQKNLREVVGKMDLTDPDTFREVLKATTSVPNAHLPQ